MFQSVKVFPWGNDVRILWYFVDDEIDETPDFYIEKSSDSGGSWDRLNPDSPLDNFFYQDTSFSCKDIDTHLCYRVIAFTSQKGEEASDAVYLVPGSIKNFRVIKRLLDQEKVYINNPVINSSGILKRTRPSGKSCDSCKDPVTGAVVNPDCDTCSGTGIEGGFYTMPLNTVYVSLEAYRKRWRNLSGNFSSDARVIRIPAVDLWLDGDLWEDSVTGELYSLTKDYNPGPVMSGLPLGFTGLIDKVSD